MGERVGARYRTAGCRWVAARACLVCAADAGRGLHAFRRLAAKTGLPICIYNNPSTTHFSFSLELVSRLSQVPNVAAIKMPLPADGDFAGEMGRLRSSCREGLMVGYSGDWGAAPALVAGADAWYIGTTLQSRRRLQQPTKLTIGSTDGIDEMTMKERCRAVPGVGIRLVAAEPQSAAVFDFTSIYAEIAVTYLPLGSVLQEVSEVDR